MGYHKVIKSGNFIESYEYQKDLAKFQREGRKGTYDFGYRKNKARRGDNVRRAVSSFVRLVRSNCVGADEPTLLTLTMLQVIPLATSWELFTEFFDRFRDRAGKHLRYIAVPEFQKRGAVHFHVLVWGLSDELILHEGSTGTKRSRARFAKWLAKKGYSYREIRNTRTIQNLWRLGYVDCLPTDGSAALAFYLSDYLTPTMYDVRLGGQRAYSASRNVLRPLFTASSEFRPDELERLGISINPKYEREFTTEWLGKCWYKNFDIVDGSIDNDMYDGICWY
jgi:hypothetical protein